MSKGNIRGITIDFDGNTTKLDKALSDVDKQTTNVNKELRQVDSLLKFNPGNADLIAQKQSLLAKQIQNTSDRLGTLKQVQSQVDAQFKSGDLGEEEYRAFQREVVATEGKLKSYQGQLAASKSSQTSLESSTKQLSSYFEASGKSVTDFADVLGPKLTSAIAEGRASSAELNTAINKIGRTVTDNSADFDKFKAALKGIDDGGSIDALRSDLKGLDTQADTTGDALEGIGKKLDTSNLMEAADGVSEVGDKLKEVGGQAVNMANGVSNASFKVANGAQTMGLSMKDAQSHITAISETGVGSIEDVGDAVSITTNQVQNLNETDLNSLTQSGMNLEQIFGSDMDETMRGVNGLMQNYGLTAQQAMDLMVKGTQEGLDKTHELGDNMSEYSQLWSQMGFSAKDTFGILQNGLKSGAYNLDKVNDFVKEFGASLNDTRIEKNIGKFSKGTQDLFSQYKKGQASASQVFKSLITDLGKSKNKQEALSTASTIWSSLGEDNAMKVITSLTKTNHAFDDTSGAADKLNQKAKDNNQWQASLTKMENSLTPIGETIKDTLQPFLDVIAKLAKGFANLSEPVRKIGVIVGIITVALLPVMALFTKCIGIVSSFGALFTEGGALAGAGGVIAGLAGPIGIAIATITAAILVIKNWGAITTWLKGIWQAMIPFFQGVGSSLASVFQGFGPLLTTFKQFFSNTFDNIKLLITGLKQTISGVLNIIVGLFTGNGAKIKKGFQQVFQGLVNIGASMLRQLITTVTSGLTAIINAFSGILGKAGGIVSRIWTGIKGFFTSGLSSIFSKTSSIFGSLVNAITHPLQTAKAAIGKLISGIKSLFNFHISWPHIPLPHFSLSGKFNPLKGQIPHVAVDWYAKGGIFNKPTLFANPNGGYSGVGEAGAEAVAPLDKLMGYVKKAVAEANSSLDTGITINLTVTGDTVPSPKTLRLIQESVVDGITKDNRAHKSAIGMF